MEENKKKFLSNVFDVVFFIASTSGIVLLIYLFLSE